MHELSICRQLITQVENIAMEHNADHISLIKLRLGLLSGIEPRLLKQAFPIACAGTIAEGALLETEITPLQVKCPQCNQISDVKINHLSCQHCGHTKTQIISGDEMFLIGLELEHKEIERNRQEVTN